MPDEATSNEKSDFSSRLLRRRLVLRRFYLISAIFAVSLSLADHAGLLGFAGNDWDAWNSQTVSAMNVSDGDSLLVGQGHLKTTRVRLLGVDAPDLPDGHGAAASLNYLTHRAVDRNFTLRLDGTQTRNPDGSLRAYVYITPADSLNADMVRDGMAYADRREPNTFASAMETSERDARSHHRGLWNGLRDSDQPAWRQAWLKAYLSKRAK